MAMIVKDSIKELLGLETEVSEIEYSKHGLKKKALWCFKILKPY